MSNTLIIDFETTGLTVPKIGELEQQPKIIEIGACKVDSYSGEILDEISAFVNPGEKIEEVITKITGITNQDLSKAFPFKAISVELLSAIADSDIIVAHNANFDVSVLRYELTRNNMDCSILEEKEIICTATEYSYVFGYQPKLIQLYQHFVGKELKQTHRALDDVLALREALFCAGFFSETD